MTRWEYNVVRMPMPGDYAASAQERWAKDFGREMDNLGYEGWEMIEKIGSNFVFKRPFVVSGG